MGTVFRLRGRSQPPVKTPRHIFGKTIFSVLAIVLCFAAADTAGAVGRSMVFVWAIWWGLARATSAVRVGSHLSARSPLLKPRPAPVRKNGTGPILASDPPNGDIRLTLSGLNSAEDDCCSRRNRFSKDAAGEGAIRFDE